MTTSDSSIDPVAHVDRREPSDRRDGEERRDIDVPVDVERRRGERRVKVERRRQIDPTTCERDYTDPEIEFMKAIDKYRRENGRPFPTWSEVLEVVRSLGYHRDEDLVIEESSTDNPVGTIQPDAGDPGHTPALEQLPTPEHSTETPATPADEAESNDGSFPQF